MRCEVARKDETGAVRVQLFPVRITDLTVKPGTGERVIGEQSGGAFALAIVELRLSMWYFVVVNV